MQIVVNGKPLEVSSEQTVAGLLRQLELDRRPAAVEVNRKLVPKSFHEERQLGLGDVIEIVTLVGGG